MTCCLSFCGCVCDSCKPVLTKFVELTYDICITQASYVCCLRSNLEKLEWASSYLKESRDNVMDLVEAAEQNGEQRTIPVEEWFKKVAAQRAAAENLHTEGQRLREKLPCTVEISSIHEVGVQIDSMIKSLTELKEQGNRYREGGVAGSNKWFLPENYCPHAEGYSNGKHEMVGDLEAHKKEVLEYLEGPEKRIVGVRGQGGVGKTTLLGLISKHFRDMEDSDLDLVIYVQVSNLEVEDIQRAIVEKMGFLNDWRNESVERRVSYIYKVLKKKQENKKIRRCVLLLDDMRKSSFCIEDIVGEHQNNPFNVVFTTRRKSVQAKIAAAKTVVVETLKEKDARKLFENAVKLKSCSTKIQRINAPDLISLCGGLPFALVKLGEALVGKDEAEWEGRISFLHQPEETDRYNLFEEMKYSYELLDADCQECFLYLCVFLWGGSYISSYELQDLLIYGDCSVHFIGNPDASRAHAQDIIGALSDEGLLAVANGEVKLHYVVRCMGLWLANDRMVVPVPVPENNRTVVSMGSNRANSAKDKKKRVLLMTNELTKNVTLPKGACGNLRKLSVTIDEVSSKMVHYHHLFKGMDALTVLKLSGSGVEELPECISDLTSVKYLDVSCTNIRKLSELMKGLHYLNVNGLHLEFEGLKEIISKLSCLRVLRMMCRFHDKKKVFGKEIEVQMLEVVQKSLECLKVLEIELRTSYALEKLFNGFEELSKKMRGMSISGYKGECVLKLSEKTGKLVELKVTWCEFKEMTIIPCSKSDMRFNNITKVTVENCQFLKELTCLVLLTFLKVLKVSNCARLEEIIRREKLSSILLVGDKQANTFPDLGRLYLESLPYLEHIYQCCHYGDLPEEQLDCPRSLPLQKLCELHVQECQKLKKLPFGADSVDSDGFATRIQLHATKDWWDKIEEEDNDARSAWLPRLDCHFTR